jgi:hypothetical protein
MIHSCNATSLHAIGPLHLLPIQLKASKMQLCSTHAGPVQLYERIQTSLQEETQLRVQPRTLPPMMHTRGTTLERCSCVIFLIWS